MTSRNIEKWKHKSKLLIEIITEIKIIVFTAVDIERFQMAYQIIKLLFLKAKNKKEIEIHTAGTRI